MKFNYQSELLKFKREHEELRRIMREHGHSEENIRAITEYDWELFKAERRYCRHNFSIDEMCELFNSTAEDGASPLMKRFQKQLATEDKYPGCDKSWIDGIESKKLRKGLRSLSPEQMKIWELYVFGQLTQGEIAEKLNISQSAVSRRIETIRKKLKRFF